MIWSSESDHCSVGAVVSVSQEEGPSVFSTISSLLSGEDMF